MLPPPVVEFLVMYASTLDAKSTEAYEEKRPELWNNRPCSVFLFVIVSCLVKTKPINVKQ